MFSAECLAQTDRFASVTDRLSQIRKLWVGHEVI